MEGRGKKKVNDTEVLVKVIEWQMVAFPEMEYQERSKGAVLKTVWDMLSVRGHASKMLRIKT